MDRRELNASSLSLEEEMEVGRETSMYLVLDMATEEGD